MTLLTFPHLVRDIPIRDEGTQWRMKKDKRTNNDLQNIHIKQKIE
jgi:hypothetical protein